MPNKDLPNKGQAKGTLLYFTTDDALLYRLLLPEVAYFVCWCGMRAQVKARLESVPRFRSRLVCVRTAVQQDLALRMQCVRNTERNRAPLSRFLGVNMNCMAGADREPFPLPWKACMPMQMTVL